MLQEVMKYIWSAKKRKKDKPFCAYIYDLNSLREHVSRAISQLPSGCRLFYAVKANSHPTIIQTLAPLVHGFEVASYGEIEKVRAVDPVIEILFGGPAKTNEELEGAIRQGVKLIHVESIHELNRLEYIASELGATVSILLRVNLRGPLPTGQLQMAGKATQFGIDEAEISKAITLAQECHFLELKGFHFHSMSNNLDHEAHAAFVSLCIEKSREWAEKYRFPLSYINVGGGIGVNYAEPEKQFDWKSFTGQLADMLAGKENLPSILFECGRFITSACGFYAVEVLDVKKNHEKAFIIVRGGSHHFRLPAAWKQSHPFTVLQMEEWSYPYPRPELRETHVTVAGELCTPNDVLARDVYLSRVRVGDVLLFQYTGAYGWDISHHDFLSHPYPEQIFLP